MKNKIEIAASFIRNSDVILIGAGAGIGCDSGLPDFRGNQGFWKHYPPYRGLFNFVECANPDFLLRHPNLFWGFYGSRLQMYRKAQPHKGFDILLGFHQKGKKQIFVMTSNVDGQFKKAGFPEDCLYQVHGNIHYLQCDNCLQIRENDFAPRIDYEKMSCQILPKCKKCKSTTRPNVLMFNDWDWMDQRVKTQQQNYNRFLKSVKQEKKRLCMIEIGAGVAIPTIKNKLENNFYHNKESKLIKINPDREDGSGFIAERFVHLEMGSLEALRQVEECIQRMG